jgi:hypothetical protein
VVALVVELVGVVAGGGCVPLAVAARPSHPWLSRDAGAATPVSAATTSAPWFDDVVPDGDGDALRARIAAAASASVGDRPLIVGGIRYRFDCSGVAAGIYARAGVPLSQDGTAPDTRGLHALVKRHGSLRRSHPLPGDLVFFDDTWDEDGNGRLDDALSHVGVVERVDDGVVVFIHRAGGRILRSRMDLAHPHDRQDDRGRPRNHWLRSASGGQPAKTTAELFAGFGSVVVDGGAARAPLAAR